MQMQSEREESNATAKGGNEQDDQRDPRNLGEQDREKS
jgi:hypothetical protein